MSGIGPDDTLAEIQAAAHENSRAHGFWDDQPADDSVESVAFATYLGNKLMLTVGEVAEGHEELRKNPDPRHIYYRADGKPEGMPFELADVIIRVADIAQRIGVDLGALVAEKHAYNLTRPPKHGKEF